MSAFGNYYNNQPFDLVTPLRSAFQRSGDRRFEEWKVNRMHEQEMERMSLGHQNALEAQLHQHGLDMHREQTRAGERQTQREFEGNRDLAARTERMNEAKAQRAHEVARWDREDARAEAGRAHELKSQNNQGRVARATAKQAAGLTRENYDHAASKSGPGRPVSASPTSVSGATAPKPRTTAAKKPTGPKKPTTPKTPKA